MEKEENTEIEELEIRIKTALENLVKKEKIVEEGQKAKSIGEKVILKLKEDNKCWNVKL